MIHFDDADDTSLKDIVVDREKVNARIRQLQAVRGERHVWTDGWDSDLLDRVVGEGLDVLCDSQLEWVFDNPIALFMLHDRVMDDGGSYWKSGA